MADEISDFFGRTLAAPLGDIIAGVGRGVAEAQAALDAACIQATLNIHASDGDDGLTRLREIGYQPTFYVLPETTCEVQVSMSISGQGSPAASKPAPGLQKPIGQPRAARMYATPVDAGFQQSYGYLAQGAARLSFKIVPVPPPAALDNARAVPDVETTPVTRAIENLQSAGFQVRLLGPRGGVHALDEPGLDARRVTVQEPAAGALRALGSTVTIIMAVSGS